MKKTSLAIVSSALLFCVGVGVPAAAQRGQGAAPPSPRQAAPLDLTGYWVSVVTEDWRFRIETDAGQQTRLLRFGATPAAGADARTWQGVSIASWEVQGGGRGGGTRGGSLKVVTTRMRPGYLRKNGVPYSENTTLTEYFDRHTEPDGSEWFTVTTIVSDPKYLAQDFITTSHFRKEPDGSKWAPTPCEAT